MNSEFDFDYWSKLFKENPEEFERRRQEEIDKVIEAAHSVEMQHRLRQLQWSIDAERQASKNPLDALVKVQKRMWDSFHKLNCKLQELTGNEQPPAVVREAKVIHFIKREKNA